LEIIGFKLDLSQDNIYSSCYYNKFGFNLLNFGSLSDQLSYNWDFLGEANSNIVSTYQGEIQRNELCLPSNTNIKIYRSENNLCRLLFSFLDLNLKFNLISFEGDCMVIYFKGAGGGLDLFSNHRFRSTINVVSVWDFFNRFFYFRDFTGQFVPYYREVYYIIKFLEDYQPTIESNLFYDFFFYLYNKLYNYLLDVFLHPIKVLNPFGYFHSFIDYTKYFFANAI